MPVSKKALIRYRILNQFLQNNNGYTIKDLTEKVNWEMEKLESDDKASYAVSDRMIRMDLENMMEVFPIEIIKKGSKYYYENAEDSIDNINLSEGDKTAITLAMGVFSRFNGTPIFDKFSDAITRILASSVMRRINTPDTRKFIHMAEVPEHSGVEWLEKIYESIVEKKSLILHYRSFGEKTSSKVVSPYLLKEYRNKWYMIACIHGKDSDNILMYKLSRIFDIQESVEKYTEDPLFDANKYFKYTLGVFHKHGEEPIDVKLKIRGKGLIKLLSEDKIHPTQDLIPINEGECYLEMKVFNSPELETFILGYGEYIEVVEPIELKNKLIKRINSSLDNYIN
jgi:predicted DNA-binding transcriptional regulator YafY